MKTNNPISMSKGMPKGVLAIIVACAIVNVIILMMRGGVKLNVDSPSYINAWEDVSRFDINIFRTPVYPLFIGICKIIFGEELGLNAVIVAQIIIFLVSIWYFYNNSMMVTSSNVISFWTTFIYAFFPACFRYNNICIMTESLSLSGMVFLVYLTLKALRSQSLKYPVCMCFVMFILLFLRPSFLFLIPIYVIGGGILFFTHKNQRKLYGTGLIGIALVTFALVGYACAFKAKYGVFATSNVSITNNYYVCRQYGILEASATNNPKLKETIEKFYVEHGHSFPDADNRKSNDQKIIWKEIICLFRSGNYNLADLNELVSNSMAMHKMIFAKSIAVRLVKIAKKYTIGPANLHTFLAVAILTFFYIMHVSIKRNRIPIVSTYLLFCYLGLFFVSIIGAQNDWTRLTFPVLPCWLLLVAQFISLFQRNPQRQLT